MDLEPNDALQGLGGPMTRSKSKKAEQELDKEVNYLLTLSP